MKDTIPSPWLGPTRGYLVDWVTQKWVQFTGRSIDLDAYHWLDGPTGETTGIGGDYFERLALKKGLELRTNQPRTGLVKDFATLESADFKVNVVDQRVRDFYEQTSDYDLDV